MEINQLQDEEEQEKLRREIFETYEYISFHATCSDIRFLPSCEESLADGRHITLQAIFTKCDLLDRRAQEKLQRMQQEIFEAAPLCLPGIITAASNAQVGIDKVRQSIVDACGLGRVAAVIQHT